MAPADPSGTSTADGRSPPTPLVRSDGHDFEREFRQVAVRPIRPRPQPPADSAGQIQPAIRLISAQTAAANPTKMITIVRVRGGRGRSGSWPGGRINAMRFPAASAPPKASSNHNGRSAPRNTALPHQHISAQSVKPNTGKRTGKRKRPGGVIGANRVFYNHNAAEATSCAHAQSSSAPWRN